MSLRKLKIQAKKFTGINVLIITQKGVKKIPYCEVCKCLMVPIEQGLDSWKCVECMEDQKQDQDKFMIEMKNNTIFQ